MLQQQIPLKINFYRENLALIKNYYQKSKEVFESNFRVTELLEVSKPFRTLGHGLSGTDSFFIR